MIHLYFYFGSRPFRKYRVIPISLGSRVLLGGEWARYLLFFLSPLSVCFSFATARLHLSHCVLAFLAAFNSDSLFERLRTAYNSVHRGSPTAVPPLPEWNMRGFCDHVFCRCSDGGVYAVYIGLFTPESMLFLTRQTTHQSNVYVDDITYVL